MKKVGYLTNTKAGLEGEPGIFYDYVLANNGLFIRAGNQRLEVTIPVADVEIRGLEPIDRIVHLKYGKIPTRLLALAQSVMLANCDNERFLAITWEGEYRLRLPDQEYTAASVDYNCMPDTVVDIHSHGRMKPWWSSTDDADEQALRIYVVVGNLPNPEILLRAGAYGYFAPLYLDEVFA